MNILEEQIIIANNNPNNCEYLLFVRRMQYTSLHK